MTHEVKCPKCEEMSASITRRECVKGLGASSMVVYGICDNPKCDYCDQEIALN